MKTKAELIAARAKVSDLQAENARLREALEMSRVVITEMEINVSEGRPGFSCDVIDEIDKALNGGN